MQYRGVYKQGARERRGKEMSQKVSAEMYSGENNLVIVIKEVVDYFLGGQINMKLVNFTNIYRSKKHRHHSTGSNLWLKIHNVDNYQLLMQ